MTFIGRLRELDEVAALLMRGRIVTLLACGGMGKTRLARELARSTASRWDDGVYFVDLASAATANDLILAVATELGLASLSSLHDHDANDSVRRTITANPNMLLVLDNVEQLLPAAANVIASWTEAAILVTSRERLRVSCEVIYELAPMDEATELFVEHARALEPSFLPSAGELSTIAQIVKRLDGIPLAVELAAARIRVIALEELLRRVEHSPGVLASGSRDGTQRQTTMRGAIEWSWQLLDVREREAFAALSVFRGSFDANAFEAVVPGGTLELLQILRDKSLLYVPAPGRLRLYEVVRDHAREKLAARDDIYTRHARWANAHPVERENLEAVMAHALELRTTALVELGLEAAAALDDHEPLTSSQAAALDQLLALDLGAVRPEVLARAHIARATRLAARSELDEAERELTSAIRLIPEGHRWLDALARTRLARVVFSSGRNADALDHAGAAIADYRILGDRRGEAAALTITAAAFNSVGRVSEAVEAYARALAVSRSIGDLRGELHAEFGIAFHHLEHARYEPARKHYDHCLELARTLSLKREETLALGYLGLLEVDHGHEVDALELLGETAARAREMGDTRVEGVFVALAGAAHAQLDSLAEAEDCVERADILLASHPTLLGVARIYRGVVDLARARRSTTSDERERTHAMAQTRAMEAGANELVAQSDDARIALRILTRAIDERRGMPEDVDTGPAQLVVGTGGTWFQVAGKDRVDLGRRGTLRALLWHLAQHRTPVSPADLIAAAWPGVALSRSAALNRLHVALTTLRSLGLREMLERRGDAYVLATPPLIRG